MKRVLSFILALALVLSLAPAGFAAGAGPMTLGQTTLGPNEAVEGESAGGPSVELPETTDTGLTKYEPSDRLPFSQNRAQQAPAADDLVTFIVVTQEEPLLSRFSIHDIANQTASVKRHEDMQVSVLEEVKSSARSALRDQGTFKIGYTYTIATTGFSVTTAYGNKAALEALPNVKSVYVAPTFNLPEDGMDQDYTPYTNSASTMIGANTLNNTGYTGKGMRVAILDTGIKVDHPSFAALPDSALADPMTRSSVDDIWDTLNASQMTSALNRSYYNSKLPFVFNYAAGTFDVSNTYAGSDHGTHVAGITAANKLDTTNVVGVAPDAQLVVMQVFQSGGGASWDTIMAALEDCVRLEVDTANLSLGSAAGFVDPADDLLETLELFLNSDIQVLIAVGNDTHNAFMNHFGLDMSLISNPDIGLAGTPATYSAALAVASADNNGYEQMYITVGGQDIGFHDTATTEYTSFIQNFRSQELEYVVVPGVGAEEDYEGLNVSGKIALISRGTTSFPEKQALAQEKGAIGCIIYNNAIGSFAMQINDGKGNIPAVSIPQSAGRYMIEQAGEDGIGTLTVCNADTQLFHLDTTVSSFTSWGVAPDLTLKPEITGVGGSIYSSVDPAISGSNYGYMSGTSMATPQIAGAMAVLIEYLDANYPKIQGPAQRKLAANLLMSTANPIMATSTLEYSPRAQGAGLADLVKATTTPAYLSNPKASEGRPKLELGDDPGKTGVYTFSFTIGNLSDRELTYEISSSIFTESIYQDLFIANSPYALEAQVETDGPITVPAGESVTVNATLTLTEADKAYLAKFPNGIYVEGYLYATPTDTAEGAQPVKLSMPILGFYGDWSAADVFDTHTLDDANTGNYSLYPAAAFTYLSQIGTNPYFRNGKSGNQYNAFSYVNPIAEIDFGMLRNAKRLDIKVTDKNTGAVYHTLDGAYMPKTYYNASYGMIIPTFLMTEYGEIWDGKTAEGGSLPDGTTVTYSFEAWLDDGDDISDDSWSFDITLDNKPPEILNENGLQAALRNDEEAGRSYLTLELKDNRYIAAVIFTSPDGTIIGKYEVDADPGQAITREFEITGFGSEFTITVGDYACNETEIDVMLDLGDLNNAVPKPAQLDSGRIYGCETYDSSLLDGGWFSANKADLSDPRNETFDSANRYYSGEFVNGYLVVQNAGSGHIELITPNGTYWSSKVLCENAGVIGDPGVWVLYDMALDHSGTLSASYNIGSEALGTDSLLAVGWYYQGDNNNDGKDDGYNALFNIKFTSYGSVTVQPIGPITGVTKGSDLLTLGITTEGEVYGIGTDSYLYSVATSLTWDETYGEYGENVIKCTPIGLTDFVNYPNFGGTNVIQSMGYDHNTDTMYWFAHSQVPNGIHFDNVNVTYTVDLETGECTEVGTYGPGGQTALFIPNDLESDLFTLGVEPTDMQITPSELTMVTGQTDRLKIKWSPWNADPVDVTWTSQNEDVVSIDEYGFITALSSGEAVITASAEMMLEGYWDTSTNPWTWVEPAPGIKTVQCSITVLPSEPAIYGYIIEDYGNPSNNTSWVTYSDSALHDVTALNSTGGTLWSGGTYCNGYVYSVVEAQWMEGDTIYRGTELYRSKVTPGATPAETVIGQSELIGTIPDMLISALAFDYNTGRMYCVENQFIGGLGIIDLETAEVDMLGQPNGDLYGGVYLPGLCVTRDGTIIVSDATASLYTIDPDTLTTRIIHRGNGSPYTAFYEAMTYDYNTDVIYWNMCDGNGESPLYLVIPPKNDYDMARVIDMGGVSTKAGTQQTILFAIPEEEPAINELPVESIEITNGEVLAGLTGGRLKLDTVTVPAHPTIRKRTWTSSNEAVVSVDETGTVTFNSVGTATVTVSITNKDTATHGGPFTDSIEVTVMEAAGEFVAFLNSDEGGSGYYDFWISGKDYDLRDTKPVHSMISIYSLRTGVYYDGCFYGYNDLGQFLRIDAKDPSNYTVLGTANLDYTGYQVTGMAMDYTTGTMYGLTLPSNYTYSTWSSEEHPGELVTIDLNTGLLTTVAVLDFSTPVFALACDAEGQLYAAGGTFDYYANSSTIYKLDKATGALTDFVAIPGAGIYTGPTYYSTVQYNTQMTYDFGTDRLYLYATADHQNRSSSSGMYIVQLGDEQPTAAYLDGISLWDPSWLALKYGDVYLGLLAFIPEADELPASKVNGIILNKTAGRVILGQTTQLVAQVRPSNAADPSVTWESSDPDIASVDENGLVTGMALGTATITATSNETGVTAICVITVVDAIEPQNVAYTVSADRDALISFNPAMPAQTASVVCTFNGGSTVTSMAYGDNCLYYLVNDNYSYLLYRFDFASKQSTFLGQLYLFGEPTGLAYDKANNMFYATAGFYLFQFDASALDPADFNQYSNQLMDSDYCNLTGVVCIDGAVYTFGSDYYSGKSKMMRYSDKYLSDRTVVLEDYDLKLVQGATDVAYEPVSQLFYMTDAGHNIFSMDKEGNVTAVDILGDGIDIQGLAIDPVRKYTITYTDGADDLDIFPDQAYPVVADSRTPAFAGTPSRTGYTFAGWDPEVAETVTGHVTYNATWTPNTYRVTFDANGGTVDSEGISVVFDTAVGQLPTPVREGHTFEGWYDEAGSAVTPETLYTVAEDMLLIAEWTANTYTVTLDYNDGVTEDGTMEVVYGKTYGELPEPTREGYTFQGWYDEAGSEVTAETVFETAGNVTLTAQWTQDHPAECIDENKDHKCDVCGETLSDCEDKDPADHKCDLCGETLSECADAEGDNDHACDVCGKVLSDCADGNGDNKCDECGATICQHVDTNPADHKCDVCDKVLSECVDENKDYKCDICGKDLEKPEDPEQPEQPEKDEVIRLAGSHRWETALKVADEMKANLDIEKFGAIIIASGNDFADALAGSYLSTVKNAPILLGWGKGGKFEYLDTDNIEYIKANLAEGGTVYILGGKNAVPELYENELKGYNVKRLGGANRFETNLLILAEAGVADGSEILVCTSTNFADSLSASATAKPILLVFNEYGKLYGKQPEFLSNLKNCTFTVIGGESAVSAKLADEVAKYGKVERLAGANRFETSVMVAQKYFKDVDTAVLAYAWNYPDGLCGGSLAYSLKAPLILTMTKYEAKAVEYAKAAGIETGLVLGGDTLISDEAVRAIFAMDAADEIIEK